MAIAFAASSAAGIGLGSCILGHIYGEKIRAGDCEDHIGMKSVGRSIYSCVGDGYLTIYDIHGIHLLGPPRMPLQEVGPEIKRLYVPTLEMGDIDGHVDIFEGRCHSLRCVYEVSASSSEVRIRSEHVAAFLFDNGIHLMSGEELAATVTTHLEKKMPLTECKCVAFRNAFEHRSQSHAVHGSKQWLCQMSPGDVAIFLHIESDFSTYLENASAFDYQLKADIMLAIGLDPEIMPSVMKGISVVEVSEGSIMVLVVVGVVVIAAAAFMAALAAGRPLRASAPQAPQRPQQQQQQQQLQNVRQPLLTAGGADSGAPLPASATPGIPSSRAEGNAANTTSSSAPDRNSAATLMDEQNSMRASVPKTPTGHGELGIVQNVSGSGATPVSAWCGSSGTLPAASTTTSASPRTTGLATGPSRPLEEVRFITHTDGEFQVLGRYARSHDNRCYMPFTLFQISHYEHKEARGLKVGDHVVSSAGRMVRVAFITIHPQQIRKLVTLRTAQSEITVTDDHRIVVPRGELPAGALTTGDLVHCGSRAVRLAKVLKHSIATEVVEIRFDPDDPIETRLAPRWSILTKGALRHWSYQWSRTGHTFMALSRTSPAAQRRTKSV